MNHFGRILCFAIAVLSLVTIPLSPVRAQDNSDASQTVPSTSALERGYRTGYSDGYQAGYRDLGDHAPREFRNKDEYQKADRAYSSAYGPLEDYRDGYQQGYEAGYRAGFDRLNFNSNIPAGLSRRGVADSSNTSANSASDSSSSTSSSTGVGTSSSSSGGGVVPIGPATNTGGIFTVPANTEMRIELLSRLSSEASQQGDRFEARVVEPREYSGAIIDGRVARVKRPGRGHGTAELQLSFDTIRLPDNRSSRFNAQVIEVVRTGNTGVRDVDPEGGVRGQGSTKDDITKVGAATGIGAIIGAIAGGGSGAAIGAAIGGGIGAGGVLASRGKDIYLREGQQLRIRTATEARF